MAASSENKVFGNDFISKRDGKNKSVREMTELSKKKELEDLSMAKKDLVAGVSTTDEVLRSTATDKRKVTTTNRKRKAEANGDVSTTKMGITTKTAKQIPPTLMMKKSKGISLAKKKLFARPSTVDKIIDRKVNDKNARKYPSVSEMVLESLKILKKRNGATLQQISAQIGENYHANPKILKPHINRFLRKAEDGGEIKKVVDVNAVEKFKLKKAVTAAKAKQVLILEKGKVELLKKTPVQKKQRKM